MACSDDGGHALDLVLRDIWVVHEEAPRGRWALALAADLARESGGRLTLAQVAQAEDEPAGDREGLAFELLGLGEGARRRERLERLVAEAAPTVESKVHLLTGRPTEQLLAALHAERPDVVVVGMRDGSRLGRLLGRDLGLALLRHAPSATILVREQPVAGREPVLLVCEDSRGRGGPAAVAGREIAASLRWRLASTPAPSGGRDRYATEALALACREQRPRLAAVARQRWPALRSLAGLSSAEATLDAAPCPVLVVPRSAHPRHGGDPMVCGTARRSLSMTPSDDHAETRLTDEPPAMPGEPRARIRARPTLLGQLFAATAPVLVVATVVLIVTPVSVSSNPVLTEALAVAAGLAIMLTIHLVLMRRTLAPLRSLTDLMGAIDPSHPGQRVPQTEAATREVTALTHAFNGMLDRIEEERRRSARSALAAQEDERLRIAREIHDQIGQTLTAVTIQAERAAEMDDPVDRALLGQIARTALHSLDDVRRIGRELRPEALDDLGLGNALITLCRRMAAQSAVRVVARLEPGGPPLTPEIELVVYRIAQEAITNALRHAEATNIELTLERSASSVELVVSDNGRGMPERVPEDTAGLSGMRERARLAGGSLRLRSRAGEGTEVRLAIPLEEVGAR